MSTCTDVLAAAYVYLFDSTASVRTKFYAYFPALRVHPKRGFDHTEYVRFEAEIDRQTAILERFKETTATDYAAICRTIRDKSTSKTRRLALFAQSKRLSSMRDQAQRHIDILNDSRLAFQTNAMSTDLARSIKDMSKVCRDMNVAFHTEGLAEAIDGAFNEINESIQLTNEINEGINGACNSIYSGDADHADYEAELQAFLDDDGDDDAPVPEEAQWEVRRKDAPQKRPVPAAAAAADAAGDEEELLVSARDRIAALAAC
jgi:uncharacterized protein YqgV (UPF0045/DUF77 family)